MSTHLRFHLGIVIPLKSAAVSKDWARTQLMLQSTINSLARQSSDQWSAVICCHDKPSVTDPSGKIIFESVSFEIPPPKAPNSTGNYCPGVLDKNRKLTRGLQLLQFKPISHWFVLDADDLLHSDFVRTIESLNPESGCIIDGGYVYFPSSRRAQRIDNLSAVCGSSTVIARELVEIPDGYDTDGRRQGKVPWCTISHSEMHSLLSAHAPPNVVADPLICYSMNHGGNLSDSFRTSLMAKLRARLKPYLLGKRIDSKIINDFGLD